MFILAPAENALLDFRKRWPKGEKIDMGAASAAILLVFRIFEDEIDPRDPIQTNHQFFINLNFLVEKEKNI